MDKHDILIPSTKSVLTSKGTFESFEFSRASEKISLFYTLSLNIPRISIIPPQEST